MLKLTQKNDRRFNQSIFYLIDSDFTLHNNTLSDTNITNI